MTDVTYERVAACLRYNPEIGELYWRIKRGWSINPGQIAGRISGKPIKYIRIGLDGKTYYAHRLAWLLYYGEWPKGQIDHINHDGLDNRICNLRDVTSLENHRNKRPAPNNTSGAMGVYKVEKTGAWQARISVEGELIILGTFANWFDAVCARKSAENKYGFHPNHGREV